MRRPGGNGMLHGAVLLAPAGAPGLSSHDARRHAARRLPFWRMRPAFLVGWIGERIPPRYLLRAGNCDPALRTRSMQLDTRAMNLTSFWHWRGSRPDSPTDRLRWSSPICSPRASGSRVSHLIQHRIHRVQRNVSARRDYADSRDGRPTAPAVLVAGTALITLIGSSWLGRMADSTRAHGLRQRCGRLLTAPAANSRHLSVTSADICPSTISIDASFAVDSCI